MNTSFKKYGTMVNPGFYCIEFIRCHNNMPKYQPETCKNQCNNCMDEVIDHHEKRGNYKPQQPLKKPINK